jgi:hypothetical protein
MNIQMNTQITALALIYVYIVWFPLYRLLHLQQLNCNTDSYELMTPVQTYLCFTIKLYIGGAYVPLLSVGVKACYYGFLSTIYCYDFQCSDVFSFHVVIKHEAVSCI